MTEAAEHIVRSAFPDVLERLVREATEALRSENERLTADIDKEVYSRTEHWRSSVEGLQAENERLRERVSEAENRQGLAEIENERLREALEKIAEHRLPFLKSSEIEIAEIASAALKGEKE
jgi:regulator of protease activity HflC (stomatin/prohibitin superfamily)